MKINKQRSYEDGYLDLPAEVKRTTDRKIEIFRENQQHPSLNVKKVGQLYSIRVNTNYRIVYREVSKDEADFLFVGRHDAYEQFIARFQ